MSSQSKNRTYDLGVFTLSLAPSEIIHLPEGRDAIEQQKRDRLRLSSNDDARHHPTTRSASLLTPAFDIDSYRDKLDNVERAHFDANLASLEAQATKTLDESLQSNGIAHASTRIVHHNGNTVLNLDLDHFVLRPSSLLARAYDPDRTPRDANEVPEIVFDNAIQSAQSKLYAASQDFIKTLSPQILAKCNAQFSENLTAPPSYRELAESHERYKNASGVLTGELMEAQEQKIQLQNENSALENARTKDAAKYVVGGAVGGAVGGIISTLLLQGPGSTHIPCTYH